MLRAADENSSRPTVDPITVTRFPLPEYMRGEIRLPSDEWP